MDLTAYHIGILALGAMIGGLILLIRGGDWTIDAARYVAASAGLSPLFIGATIVSFGTSVPELVTSVNANISGYPGLSLGNVVGSNIANILFVLGATSVLLTIEANRRSLGKDLAMMLVATAIIMAGMLSGIFGFWLGLGMFSLLVAFVAYQYRTDSLRFAEDEDPEAHAFASLGSALLFLCGGLVLLAIGSELLINGAVVMGRIIGVPEAIIGVTVVALGTSLPELSTCIAAARRRATSLILGNIIGSNSFNILSIVGITAMVKPLPVDPTLVGFDLWFLVALSVGFAAWMLTVGRVTRAAGIGLLVVYAGFIASQYQGSTIL